MDGVMRKMARAYLGHGPTSDPVLLKSGLLRLLRPIINSKPIKLSPRPAKLGLSCSNERMPFGRRENRKFRKHTKSGRLARVLGPQGIGKAKGRAGDLGGCRKTLIRINRLGPMNVLKLASEMMTRTTPPRHNRSCPHG
jgi:hypothetical protein